MKRKLKKCQEGGPGPLWLLPGKQNSSQFNIQCPEGYHWSTFEGKCVPDLIQSQNPTDNYLGNLDPKPIRTIKKSDIAPRVGDNTIWETPGDINGNKPQPPVNPTPGVPVDPKQIDTRSNENGGNLNNTVTSNQPQFQFKTKATFGNINYGYRSLSNSIQGIAAFFREKHNRAGQRKYYENQFNPLTYIPYTGNTSEQNQFGMDYFKKGGKYKYPDGGQTYKGKQKGFDKDIVYIDKGKGKLYFYDDKGNLQEKEALTGKNRKGHLLNPYNKIDTFSENQKDTDKITPIGMFPLSKVRNIYGNPGLDILGTIDKKGQGIAIHSTYDPGYRNQFYYNNNSEDNAQSYGCINCNKTESDKIAKMYANKKVYIYDSNLSDEENQKYNVVNNLIAEDNSLYNKLANTFNKSKVISYRKSNDGKLYSTKGSYDPVTETMIPNNDLKEVVVRSSKTKQIPKSIIEKQEQIQNNVVTQPNEITPIKKSSVISVKSDIKNPSIVDFLNSSGLNSTFKERSKLAKVRGIENYKGTADQNLKLLAMLRSETLNTNDIPASRKMKDGGWIKEAINSAHKGYCTPMTKSTCTPHRKAFAIRAKNHFKEDGGPVNFDEEFENEIFGEPVVDKRVPQEEPEVTQESTPEQDNWTDEYLMEDQQRYRSKSLNEDGDTPDIIQAFKNGISNVESGGDYYAQAKGSSAYGKYQFTKGTLEQVRKQFYPQIGSKEFENAYKTDPEFQEKIMDTYSKYLLSTSNTPQEAALKHFLGEAGVKKAINPTYNPGGVNMNVGAYINKFNKGFKYEQGGTYEVSDDEIENLRSQGYDIEIL